MIMNEPDDIESAIARVVELDRRLPQLRPEPAHPDHFGRPRHDALWEIASLLRSLPAEDLWRMCTGMKRPELDKVLVAWAISVLEETEFSEPAKIERRL
jgi:hypothetical protein